jgi:ABC-type lipoprotein release transport system permease subunit
MLKNIVSSYIGYIQIHEKGFWQEKTLDHSFEIEDVQDLDSLDQVAFLSHRIEGYALASHKEDSRPVAVLGLNADVEKKHIKLNEKVVEGEYLSSSVKGLLVGKSLKEIMNLKLGDSLVFISQGYQGSMAAGIYAIKGFIDLKTPELNKRTVILNLDLAQDLFAMPNRVTTTVVGIKNTNWQKTHSKLLSVADTNALEVMNWQEMLPELKQLIAVDRAGGTFVLMILYAIIGFSLFGTVLMLTEERSYEYGVLVAVGMSKMNLMIVAVLETVIMAFVGVILGLIVAFPVVYYFHVYPINLSGQMQEVVEKFGFEALIPTSLDFSIAFTHASIILLLVILINLFTVFKIKRLQPVKAMRK